MGPRQRHSATLFRCRIVDGRSPRLPTARGRASPVVRRAARVWHVALAQTRAASPREDAISAAAARVVRRASVCLRAAAHRAAVGRQSQGTRCRRESHPPRELARGPKEAWREGQRAAAAAAALRASAGCPPKITTPRAPRPRRCCSTRWVATPAGRRRARPRHRLRRCSFAARAAKRAGVRARVIGVEREPALAALATRVLAANGAALAPSTLSAACARSSALRPGTPPLPRRADIVVAEVGDDPPSGGAIRTLRHAASTPWPTAAA